MHDYSSPQVRGDRVRPWSTDVTTDAEIPMLARRDNLSQNHSNDNLSQKHNNAREQGHEGHGSHDGRFNTPSFALLSSKHAVFRGLDSKDEQTPRPWEGEEVWKGVGEPLPRDAPKGEYSVADWSGGTAEGTCRNIPT